MVLKFSFLLWLGLITSIILSIANARPSEYFFYEQKSESESNIQFTEQTILENECYFTNQDENVKEYIKLFGTGDINSLHKGAFQLKSNLNITTVKKLYCPTLNGADSLTQEELINRLTAPCRYDRLERPVSNLRNPHPMNVYVRTLIYEIRNIPTSSIHYQVRGLMQLRYNDPRLAYGNFLTHQNQPIISEVELENKIWLPKIYVANQYGSSALAPNEKKKLISLSSNGSVIISFRIEATNNCWVNQKAFPFDEKKCSTILKSYMYNSSQLVLYWEHKSPIMFDPKVILPQYVLTRYWSNESIIFADMDNVGYGLSPGNYSSLSFTIQFTREVDFFMMDYFFPSMMIVAISWVSFWLQADQTPARTTLGTSTMLSFITLTSSQGENIPKINSINISEIWFLGCTFFIFGSLVEFALVNNIWRRSKHLELKKINSKYIFKSTLNPNINSQKMCERYSSIAYKRRYKNMLKLEDPTVIYVTEKVNNKNDIEFNCIPRKLSIDKTSQSDHSSFSKMTPHDISLWIDRKARFIFPLAFIIFNGFFWAFLFCL